MKKTHNFRELHIWKESMELVKNVYTLSTLIPDTEKYGLIPQIQRCAVSIPSNIAEGSGRGSDKDFVRFLKFSISSSYELETQVILVNELFDIDTVEIIDKIKIIQFKIGGFIRKIDTNSN